MRVYVESVLPCEPDAAWEKVQTSALLLQIARPLVVLRPARGEELPERWRHGQTVRCRSYLFGVIPFGTRTLTFEHIDADGRTIQTRESDPLVRRWDHHIRAGATGDGRTHYADDVEIDAGVLTPLVWLFAQVFYRHRHRRWRAVARRLSGAAVTAAAGGQV
jgi:hypothetical protein